MTNYFSYTTTSSQNSKCYPSPYSVSEDKLAGLIGSLIYLYDQLSTKNKDNWHLLSEREKYVSLYDKYKKIRRESLEPTAEIKCSILDYIMSMNIDAKRVEDLDPNLNRILKRRIVEMKQAIKRYQNINEEENVLQAIQDINEAFNTNKSVRSGRRAITPETILLDCSINIFNISDDKLKKLKRKLGGLYGDLCVSL